MLISILAPAEDAEALYFLLNQVVEVNLFQLSRNAKIPPIYKSGVVYRREPKGCEEWQTIEICLKRGWGDCDDLATWRVAELKHTGEDPKAAPQLFRRTSMWHVVVCRGDGRIEDPSERLGMRTPAGRQFGVRPEGFACPVVPGVFLGVRTPTEGTAVTAGEGCSCSKEAELGRGGHHGGGGGGFRNVAIVPGYGGYPYPYGRADEEALVEARRAALKAEWAEAVARDALEAASAKKR